MSFWKKSDDPWDWKDEEERRPRKAPVPPPEEGQPAEPGLWEEIKDLGKVLTESWSPRQKDEVDPIPPMTCPWCGKDMLGGYFYTGRDAIVWARKRPGFLSVDKERLRINDEGGVFSSYKTAWRCESCEKLVLDTTGMRRMGEDRYVGPFTETKEEESNETREEDSNHNGTALL